MRVGSLLRETLQEHELLSSAEGLTASRLQGCRSRLEECNGDLSLVQNRSREGGTIAEKRARLSGIDYVSFFGVEDEKFGSIRSLELGILVSSLLQDRNVRIGGFP